MQHTIYSGAVRSALICALGADAFTRAQVLRPKNAIGFNSPKKSDAIGEIHGYRYDRSNASVAAALGLPGVLADAQMSHWFMDLTSGFPIDLVEQDRLLFDDGTGFCVVQIIHSGGFSGSDAYRLYRLEAD